MFRQKADDRGLGVLHGDVVLGPLGDQVSVERVTRLDVEVGDDELPWTRVGPRAAMALTVLVQYTPRTWDWERRIGLHQHYCRRPSGAAGA